MSVWTHILSALDARQEQPRQLSQAHGWLGPVAWRSGPRGRAGQRGAALSSVATYPWEVPAGRAAQTWWELREALDECQLRARPCRSRWTWHCPQVRSDLAIGPAFMAIEPLPGRSAHGASLANRPSRNEHARCPSSPDGQRRTPRPAAAGRQSGPARRAPPPDGALSGSPSGGNTEPSPRRRRPLGWCQTGRPNLIPSARYGMVRGSVPCPGRRRYRACRRRLIARPTPARRRQGLLLLTAGSRGLDGPRRVIGCTSTDFRRPTERESPEAVQSVARARSTVRRASSMSTTPGGAKPASASQRR